MKIFNLRVLLFCFSATLFSSTQMLAQQASVNVSQDPVFEQILNEKRRINASITVMDKYKIQVFNGDNESAKKILNGMRNEFPQHDGTIIFQTPSYKVWVGNFRTRIEAERNLAEIRKKHPGALIVKPNK